MRESPTAETMRLGTCSCQHRCTRGAEWDIAAGWLLVHESKGMATDSTGNLLRFNQPDPISHGILAARSGAEKPFEALVAKHLKKQS